MSGRILIVVDGIGRPAMPTQPTTISNISPWSGLLLEEHQLPPLEMPDHYIPSHIAVLNYSDKSFKRYWRENGREQVSTLTPGCVAIRSPSELRGCRWDADWHMVAVAIPPAVFQKALPEHLQSRNVELRVEPGCDDPVVRHLILTLMSEARAGCPTGALFGESLCDALIVGLTKRYSTDSVDFRVDRGCLSQTCFKRVCDYIEANLHTPMTVAELARVACLSQYHFGRLFKQTSGTTLHQYVLSRRFHLARQLLRNSAFTVLDVAAAVGLPNQSHFTTMFRRAANMTPAAYRKLNGL